MATYWENSCSFGLRYVSWYKYLIVSLVFSHLGFWSGNLFLIAPFPDLCLLVPYLSSLPIAVLRSLDTEANRFYDRNHQMYDAALLTRCYTQHALRPFIDSESNHIRSFIKIPFINKGIDFIDLPSIFQDKSVIQSIPTYFQIQNLLLFVTNIINQS